jgi:glycogen(starch) synthase
MSRKYSRVESGSDLLVFLDKGQKANYENRFTFEVAWEAANKGILSVLQIYFLITDLMLFWCIELLSQN